VGICGSKWAEGAVCCKGEQVRLSVVQEKRNGEELTLWIIAGFSLR